MSGDRAEDMAFCMDPLRGDTGGVNVEPSLEPSVGGRGDVLVRIEVDSSGRFGFEVDKDEVELC